MHFLYNVYFYDRIKTFLLNMYLKEGNYISNNIILLFCVVLHLITSVVSLALLYYDR
mgnify:CR=1 FL=1